MLYLHELNPSIATIAAHLADDKAKLTRILAAAHNATDIDAKKLNNIIKLSCDAIAHINYLNSYINEIFRTIADSWDIYRKKYPVIPTRYFTFDQDGNIHDATEQEFQSVPKPVDNITAEVIEYDNYEDIPGSTINPNN